MTSSWSLILQLSLIDIRVSTEFVLDADSLLLSPLKLTLQVLKADEDGERGLFLFVMCEMGDIMFIGPCVIVITEE